MEVRVRVRVKVIAWAMKVFIVHLIRCTIKTLSFMKKATGLGLGEGQPDALPLYTCAYKYIYILYINIYILHRPPCVKTAFFFTSNLSNLELIFFVCSK